MHSNKLEDILAKGLYVLACCQTEGNFILDGHIKTEEEKRNEESCCSLCKAVEKILIVSLSGKRIGSASVEESIADLLELYEMLHRIGYGRQPDRIFMEQQRKRIYEAWLNGNSRISESSVFVLLSKDTGESVRLADLYTAILENWLMTLKCHDYFPEVTTYENYRRLSLLMRLNLDRYFAVGHFNPKTNSFTLGDRYDEADEAKWRWYVKNRLEENALKALPTAVLKSYRTFNSSLFPSVLDYEEQQDTDSLLLEELSSRSDLHPYERESYKLLLINRKELIIN